MNHERADFGVASLIRLKLDSKRAVLSSISRFLALSACSLFGYNPELQITKHQTKHSKMYAIIADGGRQYKVEEGQILEIDFREVEAGSELKFDRVLAVSGTDGLKLGAPTLDGASVTAKVLEETKGEKLVVQKFRRRKNSKRRNGHRQKFVKVQIGSIAG
ncbi:50S ribosomal protein L21 [Mariniblastus fucicola]|uniref:Large ribosomal subunit protein bL21 n=2 Tax=Mariniblastus fucicola TaxID=980251 RepID=A0A5B9P6G5_9BACT|nr:50S ribosomal protein L21 [Mariniblastus fucicola]